MSALLAPTPAWLQREAGVLAHRVELSGPANLDLDCDLLDWIAELPGVRSEDPFNPRGERWLKMCVRYVGCLTGADRLLSDMLPDARWTFDSSTSATDQAAAIVRLPGRVAPYAGAAPVRANALLAASIRAIADAIDARPPPHANDAARASLSIVRSEVLPCSPQPTPAPPPISTTASATPSAGAGRRPGFLRRSWARLSA